MRFHVFGCKSICPPPKVINSLLVNVLCASWNGGFQIRGKMVIFVSSNRQDMKTLYFAGGCFWGVARFFSGVPGVQKAVAGYANGRTPDPTYAEVYSDLTGYAETVEVEYDGRQVDAATLSRLFFCIIDPVSLNRQGEDIGTRYRTGIYYPDLEQAEAIRPVWEERRQKAGASFAVEFRPLENFYPAEEEHQDYLEKHPGGYCHLGPKIFRYLQLWSDARSLLEGEADPVAVMALLSALIQQRMRFFWTGFYRVVDGTLVLGPFQGDVACLRIGYGKGVCGSAWAEDRTLVVPDVEQFEGHIACSTLSRSEIVVPVHDAEGRVAAVLDIDSTETDTFDASDAAWLELICYLCRL